MFTGSSHGAARATLLLATTTTHFNLHSLFLLWSDYRGSNLKHLPTHTPPIPTFNLKHLLLRSPSHARQEESFLSPDTNRARHSGHLGCAAELWLGHQTETRSFNCVFGPLSLVAKAKAKAKAKEICEGCCCCGLYTEYAATSLCLLFLRFEIRI